MTDASEPPAPAGGPLVGIADAAPVAKPVLAKGHLHPAILLLRFFDALRQAAVPVALGIVLPDALGFLIFGAVMFVLQLGYALARYLTLEFTLDADELRVREGLLERQERRIPLDRIQDLAFESTLLRRALGLSVVLVETASGRGVEARLDALARADAEHLREVLLAARTSRAAAVLAAPAADGTPTAPPPPSPEWLVHRATAMQLLVRGLTDLRLSAIVVSGFAALQLADQLGFAARAGGLVRDARSWLAQFAPLTVVLMLVGLLLVVVLTGLASSMLGNLVQFHGFTLTLRDDVLLRRYGLLTTRQKTLPRARIQRVAFEQTWLRRLFSVVSVKADSAGGSRADGEDTAAGFDVVVPLARDSEAAALLPALLPGIEHAKPRWFGGSPRLILRMALQGVVLAALAVAFARPTAGAFAWFAVLLVPTWAVLGVLVWHNLAFARTDGFLFLQHGVLGRTRAFLPLAKVQTVVVRQGPFAQCFGLADLTVYVAGGSPTRLPDLLRADARQLAAAIADAAALAARSG